MPEALGEGVMLGEGVEEEDRQSVVVAVWETVEEGVTLGERDRVGEADGEEEEEGGTLAE